MRVSERHNKYRDGRQTIQNDFGVEELQGEAKEKRKTINLWVFGICRFTSHNFDRQIDHVYTSQYVQDRFDPRDVLVQNKVEITGQKHNKQAASCYAGNKWKNFFEPFVFCMRHGDDVIWTRCE